MKLKIFLFWLSAGFWGPLLGFIPGIGTDLMGAALGIPPLLLLVIWLYELGEAPAQPYTYYDVWQAREEGRRQGRNGW
ncbi:MAG: hypothetical protein ACYCSH_07910 [Acidithiobacillus sp.]